MFKVKYGSIDFSRVLAIGESSEIGLYEVPWFGSLFEYGDYFCQFPDGGDRVFIE